MQANRPPYGPTKELGHNLESAPVDRGRYQHLVGCLIHLSHTSPDIGFDVSMAGKISDRCFTFGYCSFIWGNLVTWRSKKEYVVVSSVEAKLRAVAPGLCEGIWIKRVLSVLGKDCSLPIQMMCDNKAAISIAKNPLHQDRTKYVEIGRHFISEKVNNEVVHLNYVPTKQQMADIVTKPLPRPNFEVLNS
ncbi:hypothetical protein E5676_scaffold142G001960 [Cucumis melo var. makuwa]|uniref:Mitochondrial protein n=1 Tax=Cucumis melo var. makuwa TaxID=1194695 RepID=A0A5D3DIG5_CUCMM|nr:hypothetical protein E5676_scaffold142G001960 [Cucumis melo var. makuwa]